MTPFRWGPEHDPANWVDCPECGTPAEVMGTDFVLPGFVRLRCLLGHTPSKRGPL